MPASSNFREVIRDAQSSALVGPNVVNKALPYVGGGMVLTAAGTLGGFVVTGRLIEAIYVNPDAPDACVVAVPAEATLLPETPWPAATSDGAEVLTHMIKVQSGHFIPPHPKLVPEISFHPKRPLSRASQQASQAGTRPPESSRL